MDRAARARAELQRQIDFGRAVEQAGPPCRDCRHHTLTGTCGNPAYYNQSFEPARGAYRVGADTKVEQARSDDGLCGPEAILWEPQSDLRSVLNGVGRHVEAHPWQALFAFVGLWFLLEWLL